MNYEDRIGRNMLLFRLRELEAIRARETNLDVPEERRKPPSSQIKPVVGRKKGKQCTDRDGKTYPSHQAFAEAHNVSLLTIARHMKKYGNLNKIGQIKRGHSPEPITIQGIKYASIEEAAAKFDLARETIYTARKRGTLDKVGKGPGGYREPKKKNVELDMALSPDNKTIPQLTKPLDITPPVG